MIACLPSYVANLPDRVILSRAVVSVNQYREGTPGVRSAARRSIIRALHVRARGEAGSVVLQWAAVGLLFSLISDLISFAAGLADAHPRFRRERNVLVGFAWRCRQLPVPALAGACGKWNDPRFSRNQLAPQLEKRSIPTPSNSTAGALGPAPECNRTPDEVVAIARRELPDALPYRVQMPRYGELFAIALEYMDHRIAGDRKSVSIAIARTERANCFREKAGMPTHVATALYGREPGHLEPGHFIDRGLSERQSEARKRERQPDGKGLPNSRQGRLRILHRQLLRCRSCSLNVLLPVAVVVESVRGWEL